MSIANPLERNDGQIPPWLMPGTMNNSLLHEAINKSINTGKKSMVNPSQPASLSDMVALKEKELETLRQAQEQQALQAQQSQIGSPVTASQQSSGASNLEMIMLQTLEVINNNLDRKFISQGTVFLVCIDRSGTIKPDQNPIEIPVTLSNNPNTDIKIISYKEFFKEEELTNILWQYQSLVNSFERSMPQSPTTSKYMIFIGRLAESINNNGITFTI